jgi:hypothetical protein
VGNNWYQSTGIAVVLGCTTVFFIFKGTPSRILQKKRFAATSAEIIGKVRKNCEVVRSVVHCLAPIVLALESVQQSWYGARAL